MTDIKKQFAQSVETIERTYEFMLAYAAQGRQREVPASVGMDIRVSMGEMLDALRTLPELVKGVSEASITGEALATISVFQKQIELDAAAAAVVINAALSVPSIGSQLIDNINASIHVRTLLTDLFIVDDLLQLHGAK